MPFASTLSIDPVGPNEEWVVLIAYLHNVSNEPIIIDSVRVEGPGVGEVIQIRDLTMAPLPTSAGQTDFTPGGVFKVYPPALSVSGETSCHVQRLVPVDGYELRPDGEARISLLIRAEDEGHFEIRRHVASYRQDDMRFTQELEVGIEGDVLAGSEAMRVPKDQAICEGQHRVEVLRGPSPA